MRESHWCICGNAMEAVVRACERRQVAWYCRVCGSWEMLEEGAHGHTGHVEGLGEGTEDELCPE